MDADCMTAKQRMRPRLPAAAKVTIFGLVFAATGIVIMIFSGVDFAAAPPGLFILLVPAGLVAFGR